MNLILFMPDEMRAESLACYGHSVSRTPNYDRLAEQGVLFEQCHVQHTVCSPSRCSMMTGWYPHVAGHRTLWHLLRPHEPSLFATLRQAGYHVEWYGKNDLYAPATFAQAVNRFANPPGGHSGANAHAYGDPAYYAFDFSPFGGRLEDTGDMRCVQAGIEFLRSRRPSDPPFVLYLPLTMPHPPYAAPEPYHSMFDPDGLAPLRPSDPGGKPGYVAGIREYRGLERLPDDLFRRLQARYLGMCSCVDGMLGRLLDALDETGLALETCLIATSDHGDWAGDYGLVEKWPSALDDTLTRVPLIIREPGARAGHVIHGPVALQDVLATVLELTGVPARHSHFSRSLVPQLRGEADDLGRAVYAEGGYALHEPRSFEGRWADYDIPRDPTHIYWPKGLLQQERPLTVCRATMIRTLDWKLVYRPDEISELYDLQADPRELHNVYALPEYGRVREDLQRRLLDWLVQTSDVVPWDEDPRGLPA